MAYNENNLNEKMIKILKFTALKSLSEDCQFFMDADGNVTYLENSVTFTEEEIKKEMDRLSSIWQSIEYRKLRSAEYPSIGDQLDSLFKAGVFPEEMAAQIQAVKDKYPKP